MRADVSVELAVSDMVKREWEGEETVVLSNKAYPLISSPPPGLRKHDVCFVVTVRAQMAFHERLDWSKPFVSQVGLVYVRGCEVEGMLNEQGKIIEEGTDVDIYLLDL